MSPKRRRGLLFRLAAIEAWSKSDSEGRGALAPCLFISSRRVAFVQVVLWVFGKINVALLLFSRNLKKFKSFFASTVIVAEQWSTSMYAWVGVYWCGAHSKIRSG